MLVGGRKILSGLYLDRLNDKGVNEYGRRKGDGGDHLEGHEKSLGKRL